MSRPRLRKFKWSRSWYIVWAEGRRSRRCSTGTADKAQAERELARFEAARRNPPDVFTVDELIDAYLRKFAGTRWEQTRRWELVAVRRGFGRLPPSLITPAVVETYTADRRAAGVKDATIDKELRQLRAALHWGVRQQWMPSAPYIWTPGGGRARERWLTREEAERLIEAALEPHVRLFVLMGLHTGARTRALLGLCWDDIDLETGLIIFPPAHPQSRKRTSVVPISETLRPELLAAKEFAETPFVIEYRGRPVNSVKKGFGEAVRRAGIARCTPHDLRRTCATWMVQAGVPTARVARFLGDSEKMIERVYGQHAPDYLRVAVAALDGDGARNLRAVDAA